MNEERVAAASLFSGSGPKDGVRRVQDNPHIRLGQVINSLFYGVYMKRVFGKIKASGIGGSFEWTDLIPFTKNYHEIEKAVKTNSYKGFPLAEDNMPPRKLKYPPKHDVHGCGTTFGDVAKCLLDEKKTADGVRGLARRLFVWAARHMAETQFLKTLFVPPPEGDYNKAERKNPMYASDDVDALHDYRLGGCSTLPTTLRGEMPSRTNKDKLWDDAFNTYGTAIETGNPSSDAKKAFRFNMHPRMYCNLGKLAMELPRRAKTPDAVPLANDEDLLKMPQRRACELDIPKCFKPMKDKGQGEIRGCFKDIAKTLKQTGGFFKQGVVGAREAYIKDLLKIRSDAGRTGNRKALANLPTPPSETGWNKTAALECARGVLATCKECRVTKKKTATGATKLKNCRAMRVDVSFDMRNSVEPKPPIEPCKWSPGAVFPWVWEMPIWTASVFPSLASFLKTERTKIMEACAPSENENDERVRASSLERCKKSVADFLGSQNKGLAQLESDMKEDFKRVFGIAPIKTEAAKAPRDTCSSALEPEEIAKAVFGVANTEKETPVHGLAYGLLDKYQETVNKWFEQSKENLEKAKKQAFNNQVDLGYALVTSLELSGGYSTDTSEYAGNFCGGPAGLGIKTAAVVEWTGKLGAGNFGKGQVRAGMRMSVFIPGRAPSAIFGDAAEGLKKANDAVGTALVDAVDDKFGFPKTSVVATVFWNFEKRAPDWKFVMNIELATGNVSSVPEDEAPPQWLGDSLAETVGLQQAVDTAGETVGETVEEKTGVAADTTKASITAGATAAAKKIPGLSKKYAEADAKYGEVKEALDSMNAIFNDMGDSWGNNFADFESSIIQVLTPPATPADETNTNINSWADRLSGAGVELIGMAANQLYDMVTTAITDATKKIGAMYSNVLDRCSPPFLSAALRPTNVYKNSHAYMRG